jgi:hypothetical protein
MNAITSKLRKSEPAPAPTAADILAQIEAKKSEIKRLAQLQYDLAPKTVVDEAAERQYFTIMEDTVAAQRDIERLQVALGNLQHRAAVETTTERTAMRRGRMAEFEAVLDRRVAAVNDLSVAIELANKAFSEFVGQTKKLNECLPDGSNMPVGLIPTAFEYRINGASLSVAASVAIAAELFRTAAAPELRLPGAKALTLQLAETPQLLESMVSALRRTNDLILATVRGQIERAEAAETRALAS